MSDILEKGHVYFAYRPTLGADRPGGLEDVQRFYLILQPVHRDAVRLAVVGRKRLPAAEEHERLWGFVDKVSERPRDVEAELDAAGDRGAARPAGEGVYAIVAHGDHTHLAYALELPEEPGDVQEDLRLEPEASYVLSVKNPEARSPPEAGLDPDRRAEFPDRLQDRFDGRSFAPADPPDFLDHEGAELLLVGASSDPEEELQITLNAHEEDRHTAEIFQELKMELDEHPTDPLFEGRWR